MMTSREVAIDLRMWNASGIGTYVREIVLSSPQTLSNDLQLIGIGHQELPPALRIPVIPCQASVYSFSEQWEIPAAFHKTKANVLHSPHYNVCLSLLNKTIVTVHDLIHLKYPQFLPSKAAWLYAKLFFEQLVPRTRAILTVSERSKTDLVEMLGIAPEKITVTPLAVSAEFVPASSSAQDAVRRHYGIEGAYLLYVGNIKEFKNVPMLVRAHAALRKKIPGFPELVVIGKNLISGYDHVLNASAGVRWIPYVERVDLPALYSGALGFTFPSLYEGFGLPPLEAMGCGTPVLCSNRGSLPEVVGDAALLIDPEDESSLQEGLRSLAEDSRLRETLRMKGLARVKQFDWKHTAEKTWAVYRKCLS